MRLRKLFVISAERTETYIVRQEPPQSFQMYCEKCDQKATFLTVDQTVNLTGLGARTIFRLVEAGELHAEETIGGYLLLCPKSVARFVHL